MEKVQVMSETIFIWLEYFCGTIR